MTDKVKLLDSVALTKPMLSVEGIALVPGQTGTVVEQLADQHLLVEFANRHGEAYAFATAPARDLLVLHHSPVEHAGRAA